MGTPAFDLSTAHKFFSANCFNNTWGLIDKENRSPEEDEQMLLLATASAWHWTQRDDCTPSNLAVGFWQISRAHALLGRADEARRYGQLSLGTGTDGGADAFTIGTHTRPSLAPRRLPETRPRQPSTLRRQGTRLTRSPTRS